MRKKRRKMEIQNVVKPFADFPIAFAEGFKNSFNHFYGLTNGEQFKVLVMHFGVALGVALFVLVINLIFKRGKI